AGEVSPGLATFMAFIGAFTALFASTIAITQWDIKRVLAYSTISQLGYMVAVIAMGGYIAGLFHLVAHAFFKGLLFLGSGSVIHGMEHGMHHAHEHGEGDEHEHGPLLIDRPDGVLNVDDPQDMRNMGGLIHRGRMPWTAWTFTIGGMALAGLPILTTGFWSKDEILAYLYGTNKLWVFWVLAAAALLTAFYTARMITLSFTGAPRTEGAAHAPESVKSMVVPLVLLTPFAIGLGWIGIPNDFPLFGGFIPYWLEQYLEPHIEYMELHLAHPEFSYIPLAVSLVVALGGLLAGYFVYRGFEAGQVDPLRKLLGPIWTLMYRKYYVDEFYNATVVAFTRGLSKFLYWVDDVWVIDPIVNFIGRLNVWWSWVLAAFDRLVVDGTVNGAGWVADRSGRVLRNIQDGHVQVYLLVALVALTIWLLLEALPILLTLV
ncbi:MAG: NADH-quinone oxidoreductase subunit L, partial [Caldilineaceae bacterium]